MYQIDDVVLYGTNGVCRLVDITEKDCGGKMVTYYVLTPFASENSTVFVPVNNKKLTSRLRYVLTKEELDELIDDVPKRADTWIENERQRKEYYKELLAHADAGELMNLIKTLLEHQKRVYAIGKKLHMCDERMLQDAERMILDEAAYVLRVAPAEAEAYILNRIR